MINIGCEVFGRVLAFFPETSSLGTGERADIYQTYVEGTVVKFVRGGWLS